MNKYEKALELLSVSPEKVTALLRLLDAEISMPNIPMHTMGGHVWWNTIVEHNGWKLQQNMLTHHARILNKNDVRIAWGTINGMYKALDRLVDGETRY